jgi:anti-anti-sigma factor
MNLIINKTDSSFETNLTCTGRLDANSAGHLNDYINNLVRERHYSISLNLSGIEYLSSAGIRTLVNQYKNLASVNGVFYIAEMSENVRQVLGMVGMAQMLSQIPEGKTDAQINDELLGIHHFCGCGFKLIELDTQVKTSLQLYGQPGLLMSSGFRANHARKVEAAENHFAIGLGAIGDGFEGCKDRFGEYIMLGKNIAYLPADGLRKPDYVFSSGQLVATITELYGLHFGGHFSHLLRFEPENANAAIGLATLAKTVSDLTKFDRFAMVMLAESNGLIGSSLNASPVDGREIFSFPEVKNTINFTTELVHQKMLTVSVGVFSCKEHMQSEVFLRRLSLGNKLMGHVHTAVFPYIPLKKIEIDLAETIDHLFSESELIDILHLTNDEREITGLGESQFTQGSCWIAPIVPDESMINQ